MSTIFLEDEEAEEDMKNVENLNELYDKKLKKTNKHKSLPDKILEPVPCEEHLFCTLCNCKFGNYLEHISSDVHFKHSQLADYKEIDDLISSMGEVLPFSPPTLNRKDSHSAFIEITEPISGNNCISMMTEGQTTSTTVSTLTTFTNFVNVKQLKSSPKTILLGK